MRTFDLKMFLMFFALLILSIILNFILFRFVFFGPLEGEGVIIFIGSVTFFGAIIITSINLFRWIFFLRFFRKKIKKYASREELYEEERNSKLNYIGVLCGHLYGCLYGAIFALFYPEISFFKGVITMSLYGIFFGFLLLVLIKKRWFSYFYFAKITGRIREFGRF